MSDKKTPPSGPTITPETGKIVENSYDGPKPVANAPVQDKQNKSK
jgi:hypothetical protein